MLFASFMAKTNGRFALKKMSGLNDIAMIWIPINK